MKRFSINTDVVLATVLGIASIVTIVLEICFSDSNSTKLENTLFDILQFVFSIGFAWILARYSTRKEFEKSQKSFAVAAYRRIKEIERTANRLLIRTNEKISHSTGELKNELDVINEISKGICDTTKSSIGDWSDIIGEEISTIQEIEELRRKEKLLIEEKESSNTEKRYIENLQEYQNELKTLKETQNQLIKRLPKNFKSIAQKYEINENSYRKGFNQLKSEYEKYGYLILRGFWEENSGFDGDISELKEGNTLEVKIGDAGGRESVHIVYDTNDAPIGMIPCNLEEGNIHDFILAITRLLKSSSFKIKFLSFEEKYSSKGRKYFSCQTIT